MFIIVIITSRSVSALCFPATPFWLGMGPTDSLGLAGAETGLTSMSPGGRREKSGARANDKNRGDSIQNVHNSFLKIIVKRLRRKSP